MENEVPSKSRKKWVLSGCFALLVLACLAVSILIIPKLKVAVGPIRITDVWMTTGVDEQGNPLPPQDKFPPDQGQIFCMIKVSAPKAVNIGLRWYLNDELFLEQQELIQTWRGFSIQPDAGKVFPEGKYRVDIYLYGKKVREVFFSVAQ